MVKRPVVDRRTALKSLGTGLTGLSFTSAVSGQTMINDVGIILTERLVNEEGPHVPRFIKRYAEQRVDGFWNDPRFGQKKYIEVLDDPISEESIEDTEDISLDWVNNLRLALIDHIDDPYEYNSNYYVIFDHAENVHPSLPDIPVDFTGHPGFEVAGITAVNYRLANSDELRRIANNVDLDDLRDPFDEEIERRSNLRSIFTWMNIGLAPFLYTRDPDSAEEMFEDLMLSLM